MKKVMIVLSCLSVFSCASNKIQEDRQPAQTGNVGTFLFNESTQMNDAVKLNCSVVISQASKLDGGIVNEQRFFKLKDTKAVGFSAVGDEVLDDDVKASVYIKLAPYATLHLSLSKKNNSSITPWLRIGSASSNVLISGQVMTLTATVNQKSYQVACSDKQ